MNQEIKDDFMFSKSHKQWYIQTWFICLFFIFFIFIWPAIIGIILLLLQFYADKKLDKKYCTIDKLDQTISIKEIEINIKLNEIETRFNNTCATYEAKENDLFEKNRILKKSLLEEIKILKNELKLYEEDTKISLYSFSDYENLNSQKCKDKLSVYKITEQSLLKSGDALKVISDSPKKYINYYSKQILRCFNSECDNIFNNLSVKSIDSLRSKLVKSFETLNKIFEINQISITNELLEIKLEELNLIYTFELKKEQEKEQQKAIKEQMIEEEKVRREIEREKAKIEKDQLQCSNEINKLIQYLQKTDNDIEKTLYLDKIRELEGKLKSLEKDKENVLEREANARAGFVYIISNIGSFGDNIYKIGMTRRLEPMDRVKELSSASVPFEFDVHAMIFSDDAPALENILHKHFEKQSVNKINLRKEFFKIPIEEIEVFVKEKYNNTVEFTKIPVAKEYYRSLELINS